MRKTEGSTENGYLLAVNSSGQVRFAVGHWSGKGNVTTGAFKLKTNRWYQIEGVWDGETLRVLVDGSQCGNTTLFSGRLADTSGPLAFGALDRGEKNKGQFLDGWLSDIRIQGFLRPQPKEDRPMPKSPDITAHTGNRIPVCVSVSPPARVRGQVYLRCLGAACPCPNNSRVCHGPR